MTELHVLRVFVGPDGRGGNPLGVFVDGAAIAPDRRQAIAAELGFSETVFVDDIDAGTGIAVVRIFTPATEIPFAGHPTVGTSWLLASLGRPIDTLRCPAGDVATWTDAERRRWVRARASWIHRFVAERLASVADVDAATPPPMGAPGRYVWAWEDETGGRLRARYFATDYGILEDEATGAAAVRMGDDLGRPITIRQGVGSELLVRPDPDPASDAVEVGGRVEPVEVRAFGR
ncbi:MAG TPA: PhzF family phenazine biosynthesis protein [Candidatus Limnocylindrales bacterium]